MSEQPHFASPEEQGHAAAADISIYQQLASYAVDPSLAKRPLDDTDGVPVQGNGKKPKKPRKVEYDENGVLITKESRPRALRACDACRKNKSRCELEDANITTLCRRCCARNMTCTWDLPPQVRKPKADKRANAASTHVADDATTPGTAQMASMIAPYLAAPQTSAGASFDSVLSHMGIGVNLNNALMMNTTKDAAPTTIAELREAIAAEERELERLQLLLRYKTTRSSTESYKAQLRGYDGIKTPPELAHGSTASQAEREQVLHQT